MLAEICESMIWGVKMEGAYMQIGEKKLKGKNKDVPGLAKKESKKLVLIDDDMAFGSIMTSFAMSRGLELDHFSTLQEMGSLGRLSEYCVAIVDYDLGAMNGVEIAEYLPVFFGEMPMVLISGMSRKSPSQIPWPKSIREFVHKDVGPDKILDIALKYVPKDQYQQIRLGLDA